MDRNPQELADFGAIRPHELTPELTYKHFSLLAAALEWLTTEGRGRLESTEPLDYETWHELFENSFQVYCAGSGHFTFQHQFVMVIERGIKELRCFVEKHLEEIREHKNQIIFDWYQTWFGAIHYQLRMGARLGLQPGTSTSPAIAIRLLKELTEIAKRVHRENDLEQIAMDLYPAYDSDSREMFVKFHKAWQDSPPA